MDKELQNEKNVIYEIFRACRLCGAGEGYKMPIIANLPFDISEVPLKVKIFETLQLEVNEDDKMPPLICEVCVDKINDFYDYILMCRRTNKKTRLRLGLPQQTISHEQMDNGDCILGVTEPVYISGDNGPDMTSQGKRNRPKKDRSSREAELPVKKTKPTPPTSKPAKRRTLSPPPAGPSKRVTRRAPSSDSDDDFVLKPEQRRSKKSLSRDTTPVKGILKKEKRESRVERRDSVEDYRQKRDAPSKKVRITPKSAKSEPPRKTSVSTPCPVCDHRSGTNIAHIAHMTLHVPNFTKSKLACNACKDWFPTESEAERHHAWHEDGNPYMCRDCYDDYEQYRQFKNHIKQGKCIEMREVSDLKCEECWGMFPTLNLLDNHGCLGEDGRPGGTCIRCDKVCPTIKEFTHHKEKCNARPRVDGVPVRLEVKKVLRELRVRLGHCDELIKPDEEHCNVADVKPNFGLDEKYHYPYMPLANIKPPIPNGMVTIGDDLVSEAVKWDSDSSEDGDKTSKLLSLSETTDKESPTKREQIKSDILNAQAMLDRILTNDDKVDIHNDTINVGNADDKRDLDTVTNNHEVDNVGDANDKIIDNKSLDDVNDEAMTNGTVKEVAVEKSDDVLSKSDDVFNSAAIGNDL